MRIEVVETGTGEAERLVAGVRSYNEAQLGPSDSKPLAVLAYANDGTLIGGVSGRTIYKHFLIEVVWVAEKFRRQALGGRLMLLAERAARERGCVAAQVDTLTFQAPGFYRKLGFEVVGKIEHFPEGHDRYFLLKRYADLAHR